MARKNERERTSARSKSSAARRGARKGTARGKSAAGATPRKGGARKAAGGRKRAGTRKARARKTGRTQAAARKTGQRRQASSRRTGSRSAEAREMAQARTAGRALWIESLDQPDARPGQTIATRNHDVIRQWAEERGGVPATISGTEHDGRPGVLRFDFPNFAGGGRLREVDWDEWFETFDARRLVFLFQEQMKSGRQSTFFRLDHPA